MPDRLQSQALVPPNLSVHADLEPAAPAVAAPDIAVELDNVTFRYDARTVLSGVTMRIPRGKVVAIMGGSGSGKTTILRLIGGQLKPRTGRVIVAGKSV